MNSALGRSQSGQNPGGEGQLCFFGKHKFRVARAPREGTAELMGREECGEASGAKQEGVQTLF